MTQMAGDNPESETNKETENKIEEECSFVWDETTQLYFHASSGFYYDPVAGWYYSSGDGVYYRFENGSYVPLEADQVNGYEEHGDTTTFLAYSVDEDESGEHVVFCDGEENLSPRSVDESDACQCIGTVPDEDISGQIACSTDQEPEFPPPTSEWLEETLINHFLSGPRPSGKAAGSTFLSLEMDADNDGREEQEQCDLTMSNTDADASRDEENWRAQYGQVVHSEEEILPDLAAVDLWDWSIVSGSKKNANDQDARLVGRLVKQSAKLHPSMRSSGSLFRTAPICEVYLDLVRVRTGQVYKLRSPSARYLASLSIYDSSNPTKDWGFPKFTVSMQDISLNKKSPPTAAIVDTDGKGLSELPNQNSTSKKFNQVVSDAFRSSHFRLDFGHLSLYLMSETVEVLQVISWQLKGHLYRDRAAERRALHGGFSLGPGQKSSPIDDAGSSSRPNEEVAAEAMNMSFGAGSYARKILESMGWKEGEALGNTVKGLVEPIQAVGNVGSAGLGWPRGMKHM
ncbi:hypothetical protein Tsubulata_002926 [Turnera subulata]|uniref:G-patch domain-containing protein n=1 Tax=Turnera subulata TaxID=218843 RepID=A0A9Q0JFU8_9ROSI|nr:hypothetical protein Tsubulata_002926 [Turnera subulata]